MKLRLTRRALALSVAVIGAIAIGGTALAGHISGTVKSYTGCLTTGGELTKIKEGESPLNPCTGGQAVAHFSGGDITSIAAQAGGGLSGGGTNGAVSLSIRRDCANGDVVKWDGSTWACAADTNSTYSDGIGLDLTGTTFSIDPAYRVKNTPDCSSGQFATGFSSTGDIQCAAPPSGGTVQGFSAHVGAVVLAGQTTVISKVLPAGMYLLNASVELLNFDTDSTSAAKCSIPGYQSESFILRGFPDGDDDGGSEESVSMASAINHPGGAVVLTCEETIANVDVSQATLNALKVDSLG